MSPASTKFSFHTLSEGELIFSPYLRRLQTLYPGAYVRGSTSTLVPLGTRYELEDNLNLDSGTYEDLFSFGRYPLSIRAHKCRESEVVLEAGEHEYLSPFIDIYSTGRSQRHRDNTYMETSADGSQHLLAP